MTAPPSSAIALPVCLRLLPAVPAALMVVVGLACSPAAHAADSTSLPGGAGAGKLPIDIQADNAIEWHQDPKAYVARGHASAVRGTSTIYADVLTAYYRETKAKGAEVFRITAEGSVHIVTPTEEIFGDHGVYDTDRQAGVLTGQNLRLLTKTEVVTARDSMEYYDVEKLAVARGDAIAVRNLDRIRADILIAHFTESPAAEKAPPPGAGGRALAPAAAGKAPPPAVAPAHDKAPAAGKESGPAKSAKDAKDPKAGDTTSSLDRLDGVGGVIITTPQDVALCDRVLYSVATEIAVLRGNVRITRGTDQVNGDAAEMDMKTHVNRVLSAGHRVEGLLIPKDEPVKTPAATPRSAP